MIPRWLPNAITIARMVVAFPLLWLLATGYYTAALWLAVIAGLSDAVDGMLAKAFDCRSVLGGILDPLADKLLLSVCFIGLWWALALPTWVVAVVIGRDLVILAGAFVWWRLMGALNPEPTFISKMTTVLQLMLVASLLAHLAGYDFMPNLIPPLVLATTAMTVASGADYVVRYSLRAWFKHRSRT